MRYWYVCDDVGEFYFKAECLNSRPSRRMKNRDNWSHNTAWDNIPERLEKVEKSEGYFWAELPPLFVISAGIE